MSIRHPQLCDVIERLYADLAQHKPVRLRAGEVALLANYDDAFEDVDVLGGLECEHVHELTGRKVGTPREAAEALLVEFAPAAVQS